MWQDICPNFSFQESSFCFPFFHVIVIFNTSSFVLNLIPCSIKGCLWPTCGREMKRYPDCNVCKICFSLLPSSHFDQNFIEFDFFFFSHVWVYILYCMNCLIWNTGFQLICWLRVVKHEFYKVMPELLCTLRHHRNTGSWNHSNAVWVPVNHNFFYNLSWREREKRKPVSRTWMANKSCNNMEENSLVVSVQTPKVTYLFNKKFLNFGNKFVNF